MVIHKRHRALKGTKTMIQPIDINFAFCIVSAELTILDANSNYSRNKQAADTLLDAGVSISKVNGKWGGNKETSFIVSGPNSTETTHNIAKQYNQQAYITVLQGIATIWVRQTNGNYHPEQTFDSMEILDDDNIDNYTELSNGLKFRFIQQAQQNEQA